MEEIKHCCYVMVVVQRVSRGNHDIAVAKVVPPQVWVREHDVVLELATTSARGS